MEVGTKQMNVSKIVLITRPSVWVLVFVLFDLAWLLSMRVAAWIRSADKLTSSSIWWNNLDAGVQMWNFVHSPIRWIIEPIFFPVTTSHPLSPSATMFILYEAACLLQFAIMGYFIGLLVRKLMSNRG